MSTPTSSEGDTPESTSSSLLSATAVMAAGTIVSRLSGFVRSILLAAALGVGLHADVFNIANTVPNMLYILLAGGIVNAVLVPQLVRAMRNDSDDGAAYTNRVITLAATFLFVVTVALVVVAPWLMGLFLDPAYFDPSRTSQLDSVIAFARYCLPQVFFYGMYVLVGQVLNARGRFGPMMWAPIANNIVSVDRARHLPDDLRPRRGGAEAGRIRQRGRAAAGAGLDAGHRRAVPGAAALPAGLRVPLPAALRRARQRAGPHPAPGHVDGALRRGQPGGLHGRRAPRQQRHRRRRDRRRGLHDLRQLVPADDGAALDHHGLAGHRPAAAALAVRQRAEPARPRTLRVLHDPFRLRTGRARCGVPRTHGPRHGPHRVGLRQRCRRLRQLRPLAGALRCSAWCCSRSTTSCCAASTPWSRTARSSSSSA